MIRGAIFDFDGTLVDSMFIWKTAGNIYLRSLGKEPEKDLQKKLRALSLRRSAAYMRRAYGLSASVEEIMAGVNRTQIHSGSSLRRKRPRPSSDRLGAPPSAAIQK